MSEQPLSGRRILVVEDDAILTMMISDMLADLGCEVVGPAARVDRALALVASAPIDAALLDINLGGATSYPVAEALEARRVPFVFATGYDKQALSNGDRSAPMIRKPFLQSELRDHLSAALTPEGGA